MRFLLALVATGFLLAACTDDEQGSNTGASPTSSPGRTSSIVEPAPSPIHDRLAYANEDGDVWLTTSDGKDKTKLVEADRCPHPRLVWSAAGDRIACAGVGRLVVAGIDGRVHLDIVNGVGPSWSPTGTHLLYATSLLVSPPSPPASAVWDQTLYLTDSDGNEIDRIEGAFGSQWSPEGSRFSYRAQSGEVLIYDLATGARRSLDVAVDYLRSWVLGGSAILAFTNQRECGVTCLFDANLLDSENGALTRIPELDNAAFVLFPDGSKAITLSAGSDEGFAMTILDLATRQSTLIEGPAVSYPSEGIPDHHLVFTPDGSDIYWTTVLPFDGVTYSAKLFHARSDGSGVIELAALPALQVWFSPDFTKVAYFQSGVLYVAKIDGSNPVEIGPANAAVAWQPRP